MCGKCRADGKSSPLVSKKTHTRTGLVPTYVCRSSKQGGCGGVSIRADAVEQLVANLVVDLVESKDFAKALRARKGGDRQASAEVNRLRKKIEELEAAMEADSLSLREYTKFKAARQRDLEAALARMGSDTREATLGRFAGQAGTLRAWWDDPDTTLDQRQAVVRQVVERVVVLPVGKGTGTRFDPDRVQVQWSE